MSSLTLACGLKPEYVASTVAELSEEASRLEVLIRSVHQGLADPNTSLSEGVRLANWSKHLEAYMEGIRFALGERESSYAPNDPSSAL
jgi:hypothetical protein